MCKSLTSVDGVRVRTYFTLPTTHDQQTHRVSLFHAHSALVGTPKLDMTKADFTSGRGRKFGCLPDDLQSLLLSTVTRLKYTISAWDLANLLAKFGNLELDLTSAPPDFRDTIHYLLLRCVKHMNAWQLSRTLWGLAILNVSWDSLCSETQR